MKGDQLRKKPQQARSKLMVENILEASIRVLQKFPYEKFTTNRVAEAAGISVGSLYQYYPNKRALLMELEIRAVNEMIENVEQLLFDTSRPSEERLYRAIEYFFVTESSFYDIPFTSNFDYPSQLNRITKSVDLYLKSNEYLHQSDSDFLSNYLVSFVSGTAEQLNLRNIVDYEPWIEMTFNLAMISIKSHKEFSNKPY
tara:strand:- start:1195 stop:1791 length:597 start_codon:yes stop_codon:yes gene_type:complete